MDCPSQKLQECLNLLNVCLHINRELEKLYNDLEASADGPLYWPANEKTGKPESEIDHPVPIEIHFIDIRIGTTLIFYWATQLILRSGLAQLYYLAEKLKNHVCYGTVCACHSQTKPPTPHTSDLLPLEHLADYDTMARNVLWSAEFCMQDDLGLPVLTCPLNIVIQVLTQWPGYEREIWWARQLLQKVRERGVKIMEYLPNQRTD